MVTFLSATCRATPARKMVRPPRAAEERSSPACGSLHRARGDVDDAAELVRRHRLDRFLHQLDRDHHVGGHAVEHLLRASSSRKSRGGGPALLLTRMSGSGQAANSAAWPSAVATSAMTGVTLAPVARSAAAAVLPAPCASRPLMTTSQPASRQRHARRRGRARGSMRKRWPCGRQFRDPWSIPSLGRIVRARSLPSYATLIDMGSRTPRYAADRRRCRCRRGAAARAWRCARRSSTSPVLDARTGARVFLKAETLQRTGSFKFRGAYNKLSSHSAGPARRRRGGLFVRQPRARRCGCGADCSACRPSS